MGIPVEYFSKPATQIVVRDITERKQAEEALKASEEKMRLIIESAPVGIRICRHDRYVYVNPAFARMFGYDMRDEIIGCFFDNLYTPEDRDWVRQKLMKMNASEKKPLSIAYEAKGLTKSGTYLDLAVWVTTIEYRGEPGTLAFVIDVSTEKNLKAQLYQAQKLEAIGTLAGGIAHDFNNILGIISGYTELALLDIPAGSHTRESLQLVLKAGHRAKDLVQQILTFSRRNEQERKPLFIGSIVKEALKMLRASLPSTIEIHQNIDISQGKDTILADPTQIHQVLMNLCTNAGHTMREKGGILEVSLSFVHFDPESPGRPADLSVGPYVKLTVRDTGEGMDRAVVERIFEPYFTTKAPGEGTGLGLSVAHGIVQSHGGSITVFSEPGKGTLFNVFLPKLESETDLSKEPSITPPPKGSESILLVDDERGLIHAGAQMMERLGYKVTSRTSSLEALEAFREQPNKFDLVVTDQTMPQMTGIQLAGKLLSIRPDIPIILCTGFSEMITPEKARSMGFREFIMKPVSMQDLAVRIRRVLDGEEHPERIA